MTALAAFLLAALTWADSPPPPFDVTAAQTPEWLTARRSVIECSIRLEQFDEARKLMNVTRLLYPELGGSELKARFVELEKRLDDARPNSSPGR